MCKVNHEIDTTRYWWDATNGAENQACVDVAAELLHAVLTSVDLAAIRLIMVRMFAVLPLSVVDAEMNDDRQLAHGSKLNEAKCVLAKIREGQTGPHFSDEVHKFIVLHRAECLVPLNLDFIKELQDPIVERDCVVIFSYSWNENKKREDVEESNEPSLIASLFPEVMPDVIDASNDGDRVDYYHYVNFDVESLYLPLIWHAFDYSWL